MPTIQTITSATGTFPYVPTSRTLTINGVSYDLTADRSWTISTSGTGTVTSVGLSATMPTGLVASISGSPVTSNGTLGLTVTMQSGYAIPTTAKQTQWDSAYTFTSTFPSGSANQLLRVNSAGTALEFFTASFLSSTGTTNYIPKFTSATSLGDSIIEELSGAITVRGNIQTYKQQAGAGQTNIFIDNRDTAAAQTNSTILSTQHLGSGQARTLIYAASYTAGNKNRGELGILTENGSQYVANIGTSIGSGENAFSLFSTGGVEAFRLNAGGNSWLNGGNVGINTNSPSEILSVNGNTHIAGVGNSLYFDTTGVSKSIRQYVTNNFEFTTYNDRGNTSKFVLGNAFISLGTNPVAQFYINTSSGNIGINQTTPLEKLDVVGNIKLSGNVLGGTWQGNTITPAYGGTGATTLTGVVIGNGTSTMTAVSGTAGQLLRRNASNTAYEFFTASFIDTSRTITINGVTQDLSANRTYNVGTVTSVAASAGTGISISGSPITSSGTITITNTAPDQVVSLSNGTGISITGTYPNFTITNTAPSLGGTVTSVGITMPTGFSVASSPITSSGTIGISFASGYSLPTTAKQTEWDAAYNDKINSASVTGTTTKTLTLNQQDGGTITASWTDINTDAVTSVFGRTGAVVAANGDYTTAQVTESGNLYYTDARARAAISLTTTGSSGAATYTSGVLNIPNYTLSGLGGQPQLNGTGFVKASGTTITYDNTSYQPLLSNPVTGNGSGSLGYFPKFSGVNSIENSNFFESGTGLYYGGGSASDYSLQIGHGRTGNGFAYIDLVGDTTYNDYGMRLLRGNTGANSESVIEHRGTGNFILKTVDSATINFQTGSTDRLSITPSGLVVFTDSARFLNLKGCFFAQTGGTLLGSISMDSGNTLNLDNNGFIGISVGSNYTFTSSNFGIGTNLFGTSGTRVISVSNGTAPSTSPTDVFQMYSNDVTAGNAAAHFRTENGAVIKLYQETTSVGNAIFSQGGGTSVLDDSTFDGYTIRQIVKALRNLGILQ